MTIIQLRTVSGRTDPSDYWPEDMYEVVEYTYEYEARGRTRDFEAVLTDLSLDAAVDIAKDSSFIVSEHPDNPWHHPDAEIELKAYDGYNE